MKVCLYITAFGPGGAERQIVNLARELAGRGVHVVLLHAQKDISEAHYLDSLQNTDVEIASALTQTYLKSGMGLSRQYADFFRDIPAPPSTRLGILYLAGAFCRLKPDVVHSFLDLPNCTAGCAAILAQVPVHLASFRSVDPETGKSSCTDLFLRLYRYILAKGQPSLEANSKTGLYHYARWLDIDPNRLSYSPNGIDPSVALPPSPCATRELRRELGIPDGAPTIVTLARFMLPKSPESMLDIFASVHARRPKAHYIIAGSGMAPDEEMGDMVRARGLEKAVHLLGVRSDVDTLLACADTFLLPSRFEGFPNAVMEAMALGLPVVASNVGALPDLVRHGQDGFLHDAQNTEGMARSVLELLTDAGMRTRFGENARQRVLTEFSMQKLGDRVIRRYGELLAERSVKCDKNLLA